MRTRFLMAIVALGVAGSLWYGQAPPRSAAAFRQHGQQTATLLLSQTRTASLWIQERQRGRVTDLATGLALQEAESDAATTVSRFSSYDVPGSGSAALRTALMSAAEAAQTGLSQARIAARAGAWEQLPDIDRRLVRAQDLLRPLAQGGES